MATEPFAEGEAHPPMSNSDSDATRARVVSSILRRLYPDTTPILRYSTPFELLIAVILSAQTTDKQVNAVTPQLFSRFSTPEALAAARVSDLEEVIHSTGFFRSKARNIRATAEALAVHHSGEVPREMDKLLALPGVGRKTAHVLRGVVYGLPAIIVDTHFSRVVRRIGLSAATTPERVEDDIASLLPAEEQFHFSMAANNHGRNLCIARWPLCAECPLRPYCDYGRQAAGGNGEE